MVLVRPRGQTRSMYGRLPTGIQGDATGGSVEDDQGDGGKTTNLQIFPPDKHAGNIRDRQAAAGIVSFCFY